MLTCVIEIEAIGPCWVCDDTEGDPGRTGQLKSATRYAFDDAVKRAEDLRADYPHRNLHLTITETA